MSTIVRFMGLALTLVCGIAAAETPLPRTFWVVPLPVVQPTAIALDGTRARVFVADAETGTVRVGDLATLASQPHLFAVVPGVSASLASGMAVGADGALFLADLGVGVDRYSETASGWTRDPTFALAARQPIAGKPLVRPRDLAITHVGTLLVLDSGNARIVAWWASGWRVVVEHPALASATGIGAAPDHPQPGRDHRHPRGRSFGQVVQPPPAPTKKTQLARDAA